MYNLWPTNLLVDRIDNKELIDDVLQNIFKTYDLNNNVTSDLNNSNILKNDMFKKFKHEIVEPAFESWLKTILNKSITEFDDVFMKGWITGCKNGYNMVNHNHSGASLSAVFYLMVDENNSGNIFLFDPRTNANRGYKKEIWGKLFEPFVLKPESYTFAVFPSFLYHQVTPFNGNIRLAIPVDLYL